MTGNTAPSRLHIKLLSDATFGRGTGTAGEVDIEVEHDAYGLPFIGGKTVRGLLRDSWLSMCTCFSDLTEAAARILGRSQSLDEACRLRIGDAHLPEPICMAVHAAVDRSEKPLSPEAILAAFTEVRCQTAEDRRSGAPEGTTLRRSRVVVRGFTFEAPLSWLDGYHPDERDLQVLALCALSTRHGGLARNRGRGHLGVTIEGSFERTRRLAESSPALRLS